MALSLSRNEGEEFIIIVAPSTEPTIIRHTTERIKHRQVKHSFVAPEHAKIYRREVYDRVVGGAKLIQPRLTPEITREEIEAAKTPQGGWTRESLAAWGVPWPPPRGWKRKLLGLPQ